MSISINNNKIAFFDSGTGGLTVYSKFRQILSTEDCIYFGDLKHMPYGSKTREELISYCIDIFNFFKSKNVKAVIMACNTTSASAYSYLQSRYDFKIYPIIQSCAKIIASRNYKSLGVLATESTINSGVYESEIKKYNPDTKIFSQSCPKWADIAESGCQEEEAETIKSDLDKVLIHNPEKIILGCTHYPYLMETLSKYAPKDKFIDPADYFAEYIAKDLTRLNLLNSQTGTGCEEFYVSASPENFKQTSKMFYEVSAVKLEVLGASYKH